jgi:hypothetical protein
MIRTSPAIAASAAAVAAHALAALRKTLSRERFEERPLAVTLKAPGTGTVLGTTSTMTVYGDPATATPLRPHASASVAAAVISCRR